MMLVGLAEAKQPWFLQTAGTIGAEDQPALVSAPLPR